MLADVLLGEGKLPEARQEIEAGEAIASKSQNLATHLNLEVTAGCVRAALGNPVQARTGLENALAKASRAGYVSFHFQARLALDKIEMQSGNTEAGRDQLASLEKEARAKGFLLIARKAAASVH